MPLYVKARKIRFLKFLKFLYPKAFRLITLMALLVPSVYPFVYGQSKAFKMYFDQFRSIVRQALNSGRLLASAAKIKNFNRRLASVLSGDFIKSKNNSFKW